MIRVALVSHLSEISGAGIALLRIARALNPSRFQTCVVLPGKGPLLDLARNQGIPHVVIENPEQSWAAAPLLLKPKILARRIAYLHALTQFYRRERFDVVYVNTTITVFAGLAARLAHLPVVWHVRELLENPSRAARAKMWLIDHLADAIFYASAASMALFPACRVRRRLVVRNIVDVERFVKATVPPLLDEELGIVPGEIVITSNGVFPRKAPDLVLRAAALLCASRREPIRVLLVGPTLPEHRGYVQEMRTLAAELGIANRVTFTGLRNDMPSILARSDVFVSASRNEAQPNIINEALVAGVPVVATNVGDCRAMLRDGEFGEVVPPENPHALAAAIARILDDRQAARARARRAQAEIIREFTSPTFWQPVEQVLEELARKNKDASRGAQ
ncbi:MAG: glycosyltransferase [Candidatus Sumerlaeaceae bacterium]|jgi:glycosyltransferase involved in cell wall biosynthesis